MLKSKNRKRQTIQKTTKKIDFSVALQKYLLSTYCVRAVCWALAVHRQTDRRGPGLSPRPACAAASLADVAV